MVKIILATSNPHKAEEINTINTYPDIVFDIIQNGFDPDETGLNFKENALIKAREAAKITGTYCLADDSGLCADALAGRPGVYSSRYARTSQERIEKLLTEMRHVPYEHRSAHFTCIMVLADKDGNIIHEEEGKVSGFIDYSPKGSNGFGYDPVFFLKEYNKTMAQLTEDEKNKISHRANALRPMLKWISENLV